MQMITAKEHGPADVLTLETGRLSPPAEGKVLVAVHAAGVNFFDTQLRSGLHKRPLPLALGTEGSGVVVACGPGTDGVSPGDRVAWIMSPGSYATEAIVPIERLVRLPDDVDCETAAAIIYQGVTAHYLARSAYAIKPGDWCIVHSAAGGVGGLLCQMAKIAGATVIATVSSEAKVAAARQTGADHVIIYTTSALDREARGLTSGRGVDVVYDAVGLETYRVSLAALRSRGFLVLYGEASGLVPPIDVLDLLRAGSVYVTRAGLDHYVTDRSDLLQRTSDIFVSMREGGLKQNIVQRFPLDRAAEAHRAIEARGSVGKVLLIP